MSLETAPKVIEILLAEDNPGDVRVIREAFKKGEIRPHINRVPDGEAALAFLRHEGDYEDAVRPDLILLDLNMPRKDGRQLLSEIKNDPDIDCIPCIVLTSSEAEQ